LFGFFCIIALYPNNAVVFYMQANRASAATVEGRRRSDDFYTTFSLADTFVTHLFLLLVLI
jgi:hypothetical protein